MIRYIKDENTRLELANFLFSNGYEKEAKNVTRNVPKKLYKYTNLSKYTINNLENSGFTITNPKLFNDVYDCNMHRNSLPRVRSELEEINKGLEVLGYDKLEINQSYLEKDFAKRDRYFMTYMTKPIRVGCLSEDEKSILMWSHYANDNKGICIEYDFSNCNHTKLIYPVTYLEKPIDITSLCNGKKENDIKLAVLLSVITKCNVWSYEKEWRIIHGIYGGKELPDRTQIINMPTPTAIYLGKNFLEYWLENKSNETEIFNRFCEYIRKNNIKLKIMQNKIMSFKLEAIDIDLNKIQSLDKRKLII